MESFAEKSNAQSFSAKRRKRERVHVETASVAFDCLRCEIHRVVRVLKFRQLLSLLSFCFSVGKRFRCHAFSCAVSILSAPEICRRQVLFQQPPNSGFELSLWNLAKKNSKDSLPSKRFCLATWC